MGPKRKDVETGQWVGRGEDAAYEIFCKWYGKENIQRWVKIKTLINLPWEDYSRVEKETIDLIANFGLNKICVRLQDDRHKGVGLARLDEIQKRDLEKNPFFRVISIFEENAPQLFKDIVDQDSELEIWLNFFDQGILLCPHCHAIGRTELVGIMAFCDACGQEMSIKFVLE